MKSVTLLELMSDLSRSSNDDAGVAADCPDVVEVV